MKLYINYTKWNIEIQLHIYPGVDADFELYEDEGDNYNFENGNYSRIPMHWSDAEQKLTIGNRRGSFWGMEEKREFKIICGNKTVIMEYNGESCTIQV